MAFRGEFVMAVGHFGTVGPRQFTAFAGGPWSDPVRRATGRRSASLIGNGRGNQQDERHAIKRHPVKRGGRQ